MRNKRLLIILLIFIVGVILYTPNLHNRLFWDDEDWIINNSYVHNFSWQNLKFIFSHDTLAGIGLRSNYYRPFLFLTFLANYVVSGAKPLIYHLTNNFIHIANAVLIFFLLDRYLKKRITAFLASLLFLIHPLQTEAVVYISGRGDPLSVLLMLVALLLFLKAQSSVRQLLFIAGSFLFFILAILSRETAFLFPLYLMVFLIAFIFNNEKFLTALKKSLWKTLPYFGISLVYGILRLTVLNFQNTLNFYQQSNFYTEHLSYRIYTFFHVLTVYFKLIFIPTGLHMERDIAVNASFFQWPVWLGALLIVGVLAALLYFYKKEKRTITNISDFRIWFFAAGVFFINLAPTSGIFPINALLYEHWLYLSLLGFFTLLAFYSEKLLVFLRSKTRPIFYVFSGLLLVYAVFLSVQTVKRNIIWGKTGEFYENVLKYEPQNVRVLNNLANYYSNNGQSKKAEDLYWRAVDANDVQPSPYYNLGNILGDRKDYAGAIELYKKAIRADSSFSYAYTNLAALYARQGNLTEALKYLKQLVAIQPENPMTYYNIAQVESALGHKKETIKALRTGLKYAADGSNIQVEINKFLEKIK